jgi:hypothetical protein
VVLPLCAVLCNSPLRPELGLRVPANKKTKDIHNRLRVHSALEGTNWHLKAGQLAGNGRTEIVSRSRSLNTKLGDCGTWENLEKDGKNNKIGC